VTPPTPFPTAPNDIENLTRWVTARIGERSAAWKPRTASARILPTPVNLPGMEKAAAAVLSKYRTMPVEWTADVVQDFMALWLLRPQTPETIARSALSGVARRHVASVEAGIAWKLRMEILSRANRAYRKSVREQEVLRPEEEFAGL